MVLAVCGGLLLLVLAAAVCHAWFILVKTANSDQISKGMKQFELASVYMYLINI